MRLISCPRNLTCYSVYHAWIRNALFLALSSEDVGRLRRKPFLIRRSRRTEAHARDTLGLIARVARADAVGTSTGAKDQLCVPCSRSKADSSAFTFSTSFRRLRSAG